MATRTGKNAPTPAFPVKKLTANDRNSLLRGYFDGAEQVIRHQDERWDGAIHFSKRYEAYAESIINDLVRDWTPAVREFANVFKKLNKAFSRNEIMELIGWCLAVTIEEGVNGFEKYAFRSNARITDAVENLIDILMYELGIEWDGGFKALKGKRGGKEVTVWTTIGAERYAREGKRYSDFGSYID